MNGMLALGAKTGARVLPVYAVSDDVAASILDLSATLGIDMMVLGAPQRSGLTALLRGDVVTEVAKHLPETIQLLIHGSDFPRRSDHLFTTTPGSSQDDYVWSR